MGKNIFCVTSKNGDLTQYFDSRDSAIAFIIDELSMALSFHTDKEGEKLTEYMNSHNETPNQYPYKLYITELKVNHDYDKKKSYYMIHVECVDDSMPTHEHYIFRNYEDARNKFDELVDEDMRIYGDENDTYECFVDSTYYERFDKYDSYLENHYTINFIELEDNDTTLDVKYSNE